MSDYLTQIQQLEIPPQQLADIVQRSLLALLTAFGLGALLGKWVIRWLLALKLGQSFRGVEEVRELAEMHGKKIGTPTMGGVLIVAGFLLSQLCFAKLSNPFVLAALLAFVALGVLGFFDDFLKVKYRNADGVSARVKLLVQGLVGVAVMLLLWYWPANGMQPYMAKLYVPFYGCLELGWWCLPFGVLVVTGMSNAVNLTDGLDGLAAGCSVPYSLAFGLLALISGNVWLNAGFAELPHHPAAAEMAVVACGLVGSCLGFLWFNCYPAKVFMGDTGSLAIGGVVAVLAIATRLELVSFVIGIIFVIEAGSVMLQVASFKTTRKRIFRMSPIHHHFELGGLKETQVIARFWIVALIGAALGVAMVMSF